MIASISLGAVASLVYAAYRATRKWGSAVPWFIAAGIN
jgi:hypothetical protein